jgi:hypothetical protein
MNKQEIHPTISEKIQALAPVAPEYAEILTSEALNFIEQLQRNFGSRRLELLGKRQERQEAIDAGNLPDFLPETRSIREDHSWKTASTPADLQKRWVEITGPTDRKMLINALNSGANIFMADFEDANSPTWANMVEGQINLRDAIDRTITFTSPDGKNYRLNADLAVLMVRPRGWHLPEKHVLVNGEPVSGSLFDFGLYFFHNAKNLIEKGTGPYFYLPKMESHLEARLWNDVFNFAQDKLGIPRGTIRATVLIETILAAFEMEEIIYELRDHIVVRAGRLGDAPPDEKRPQRLTNSGRQHAFEILERRSSQLPVLGMKAPERNLERFPRQHQRKQREDVREALAGAVADELVERRLADEAVEEAPAFPDRPANGDFAQDQFEDLFPIDVDARVLVQNCRERSRGLEADVESRIYEREHQAIGRALRDAHGKNARQAPPDREILIGIEQRIDQLADVLFGNLPQCEERMIGDGIPGEERDGVGHQRRRYPLLTREDFQNPLAIPRAQRKDVANLRVGMADPARAATFERTVPHEPAEHFCSRPVMRVRQVDPCAAIDEAVLERPEIPAIQTTRNRSSSMSTTL